MADLNTSIAYLANQTGVIAAQQINNGVPWWIVFLAVIGAVALIYSALSYGGKLLTWVVLPVLAGAYFLYQIWKKRTKQ